MYTPIQSWPCRCFFSHALWCFNKSCYIWASKFGQNQGTDKLLKKSLVTPQAWLVPWIFAKAQAPVAKCWISASWKVKSNKNIQKLKTWVRLNMVQMKFLYAVLYSIYNLKMSDAICHDVKWGNKEQWPRGPQVAHSYECSRSQPACLPRPKARRALRAPKGY